MKTKNLFLLFLLCSVPTLAFSQSKKMIRSNQLASKTVYEYFVEEGIKEPLIESIEVYDEDGNVIEHKEFNSNGDLKSWTTFKFDENGNKIEEAKIDNKGNVIERIVWIYKNDLVIEKQYYDKKDRLTKRKEYKYEYRLN